MPNNDNVIHKRQHADGWPVCWGDEDFPEDDDVGFEGSYNENEVTCTDCIEIITNGEVDT